MIVVMRPTATQEDVEGVKRTVEEHGLEAFLSVGEERTVIGVVGSDVERVAHLGTLPGVEQVIRISTPYKLASSEHQKERTRVRVNGGRTSIVSPMPTSHASAIPSFTSGFVRPRRLSRWTRPT